MYAAAFMSPVDFFGGPFTERVYVRHRDIEMKNAAVQGASPAYFKMGVTNIAEGRYFTDEENALHANVVVIGNDVANTLFPYSNAARSERVDQRAAVSRRRCACGARHLSRRRGRSEQRKQSGLHAVSHACASSIPTSTTTS